MGNDAVTSLFDEAPPGGERWRKPRAEKAKPGFHKDEGSHVQRGLSQKDGKERGKKVNP